MTPAYTFCHIIVYPPAKFQSNLPWWPFPLWAVTGCWERCEIWKWGLYPLFATISLPKFTRSKSSFAANSNARNTRRPVSRQNSSLSAPRVARQLRNYNATEIFPAGTTHLNYCFWWPFSCRGSPFATRPVPPSPRIFRPAHCPAHSFPNAVLLESKSFRQEVDFQPYFSDVSVWFYMLSYCRSNHQNPLPIRHAIPCIPAWISNESRLTSYSSTTKCNTHVQRLWKNIWTNSCTTRLV